MLPQCLAEVAKMAVDVDKKVAVHAGVTFLLTVCLFFTPAQFVLTSIVLVCATAFSIYTTWRWCKRRQRLSEGARYIILSGVQIAAQRGEPLSKKEWSLYDSCKNMLKERRCRHEN
jgi:hypothetical protein